MDRQGWYWETLDSLSRLNSLGGGEHGSTGMSDSPDNKIGPDSITVAIGTKARKLWLVHGIGDGLLESPRCVLVPKMGNYRFRSMKISFGVL